MGNGMWDSKSGIRNVGNFGRLTLASYNAALSAPLASARSRTEGEGEKSGSHVSRSQSVFNKRDPLEHSISETHCRINTAECKQRCEKECKTGPPLGQAFEVAQTEKTGRCREKGKSLSRFFWSCTIDHTF